MIRIQVIFLIFYFIIFPEGGFAQISKEGDPPSFKFLSLSSKISEIRLGDIDFEELRLEDERNDKSGLPFRYAILLPVNRSLIQEGNEETIQGVGSIWRLRISTEGALAMAAFFDTFYIPPGGELFVYNEDKTDVIGAFGSHNMHLANNFATELISGNSIILEYFQPKGVIGAPSLVISEVAYAYRGIGWLSGEITRGFGNSGSCEVNVNCIEGNNYEDQKDGVTRISVRIGSSSYWCSGVLMNNTQKDYEPYILTADHCAFANGKYASQADLNQWVFYFNYQASGCTEPVSEPEYKSMTGASLVAHGGNTGNSGSDFYLVVLKDNVPGSYNPYFNGWNRLDESSSRGVGIHHPRGDIKKISTYITQLISKDWNHNGLGSHWEVIWSATTSGHGVTEGGSSGSPIYDNDGYVIGTLTGGEASCSNLDGPDYYGKFSYSWESNGTSSASHLKEWLDPINSGIEQLEGSYYDNILAADFKADTSTIPINNSLDFLDLSAGDPSNWEWTFEGGEPSGSESQNPTGIKYNKYGLFDVRLVIKNDITTDTVTKLDYIKVEPVISPNPSEAVFDIYLGEYDKETIKLSVFNTLGEVIKAKITKKSSSSIGVDLGSAESGMYYIRINENENYTTGKVILID